MSNKANDEDICINIEDEQQCNMKNVVFEHKPVNNISELGFTNAPTKKTNAEAKPMAMNQSKSFSDILPKSYEDMDLEFLNYLKFFNENSKTQEGVKCELMVKFFWCVMVFMAVIILFPYMLVIMFRTKITDFTIITLSISSLAETLSAVIVLPKIIAKYLFNKEDEKNKIKIISDMQTYNRGKREQIISGENKEEC